MPSPPDPLSRRQERGDDGLGSLSPAHGTFDAYCCAVRSPSPNPSPLRWRGEQDDTFSPLHRNGEGLGEGLSSTFSRHSKQRFLNSAMCITRHGGGGQGVGGAPDRLRPRCTGNTTQERGTLWPTAPFPAASTRP